MNILYIHQYFKTPKEPGGTRSYWLAKELVNQGHTVTMLTSRTKNGKIPKEKVDIDGIEVIYLNVPYDQNMNILQRIKSFTRFMLRATRLGLKEKNLDLVIATSTPLTVGVPALIIKLIKKVPYIFEVRDLWPEVPIQMGGLNNPILKYLARGFEKMIYRKASHVVALSPGMQEGVTKYIDRERTTMIPNMAKMDEFWPRDKDLELMCSLELKEDSFKIVHFGSLGLANGAEYIINAAKILKNAEDIEFIFAGGGKIETKLRRECKNYGIKNVHFFGKFPMKEISEIVNFCDVSVVSFMNVPILNTNSPNKLFDSLSAGKPIIVNSCGWTKDLVEKNKCGYFVDPNKPNELAKKILYLKDHPEERIEMGLNARMLAKTKYDKSILCAEFAKVVAQVI